MNFVTKLFSTKKDSPAAVVKSDTAQSDAVVVESESPAQVAARVQELLENIQLLTRPKVVSANFMTLFHTVPEVFWPIDYIAKRISEAHFDIRRQKDDSIVWCDRLGRDRFLKSPNPVMCFRELVYQHFVYILATGNAFTRAAMSEALGSDALKCQWCSSFWELPADMVKVEPANSGVNVPIFGVADTEDIIKGYRLSLGTYSDSIIPARQVWHDRDGMPDCINSYSFLKAKSRLQSVMKPIANLIAVYEARNVIYVKRGGLGFIVTEKKDETGTVALDSKEKKELRDEFNNSYGVAEGKSPYVITDVPVRFERTNLTISDLQPFDETLEDAVKIASVFGIPAVLVPRKDQSTFSNQDSAEKSVYTSTIIPTAKRFCDGLTRFLELDKVGLYLDCDFSDVACLQSGRKESEQVKELIVRRGLAAFNAGLCTLDDIRAQLHESQKADTIPLYGKLKFEMTPKELETVNNIINHLTTSKGERNERDDEKPAVRDEGD